MDIELYLKQLRAERDKVHNTILALESIAVEQTGKRSRNSAKSLAVAGPLPVGKRRGRPLGSGPKGSGRKAARPASKTK